ncbi:MAG TPA: tetratricopeptide repeat protein [Caulifigura sp.]|nr:tetratricopeptide repeat protein [Caulifigura sp.]
MRDPLTFALSLLFLVLVGEGVLWAKRNEKELPRWKIRGLLWLVGLLVVAYEFLKPPQGIRLDLILYPIYLLLAVLLAGAFFVASRILRGVNRTLMQAQELHSLGRTAEAIDVLNSHRTKAARLDRNTESILLTEMARLSIEINDLPAAEQFLAEAEALSGWNQGVYAVRAELFVRKGDRDAACTAIQRGLEKLPGSIWLNTALAEQLADAGRDDEAREALVRTIELMDRRQNLDVADPEDWREKRVGPLVQRLGQSGWPLVTARDS